MITVSGLVWIAGWVQLGMVVVALVVPRLLRFQDKLAVLTSPMRQVFWVYNRFIAFVIAGMGVVSIAHATTLADGTSLGRSICFFCGVFWTARLGVQLFVFKVRAWTASPSLRAGYYGLTAGFVFLSGAYMLAAFSRVLP